MCIFFGEITKCINISYFEGYLVFEDRVSITGEVAPTHATRSQ